MSLMQNNLLPPASEVWGKVMFLHLCTILITGGGVCLWRVCLQDGGLPPEGGLLPGGGSAYRRGLPPEGEPTSGGSASRGLGLDIPPLRYCVIRSTSRQYASYWGAFLFPFCVKINT